MLKNFYKIKEYLEKNPKIAIDVAHEINCYNGELSFVDTWDLTELVSCYCNNYENTKKFLDNIILNSLDTLPRDIDTPVRFSEYGDYIEAVEDDELEEEVIDYIDDIMDYLDELWNENELRIEDKTLLDLLFDFDKAVEDVYQEAEKHYKSSEITADILTSVADRYFYFSDEQLDQLRAKFDADELRASLE